MDEHMAHAQSIGDKAGMLPACTAKTIEHIARHIIAACDGDFLDRFGHIGNRNADETVSQSFRRAAITDLLRKMSEGAAHGFHIERLVLMRAENLREVIGAQLAQHHIGICHSKRAAAPIASRPRISTR